MILFVMLVEVWVSSAEKKLRLKDNRFEDADRLLSSHDFRRRNTGGFHYVFTSPSGQILTIPKHKPVKEHYVRAVVRIIENEEGGQG